MDSPPLAVAPVGASQSDIPELLDDAPPGLWERLFLVLALLGQQDAFLNVFRVLQGRDASDQASTTTDPLNFLMVAFTIAGLLVLFIRRRHLLAIIIRHGLVIFTLCGLTFVSALWSDGFGLTSKRAIVHLDTVMLALYLATRLNFVDALRYVATSVAIGAVGSFVAGAGFHSIGLMHTPGLEGRWRGVYSHKNPLAQAMAIGVIIEAFLQLTEHRRNIRLCLIGLELLLIALSNSITVLGIVLLALSTYVCYALFKRGGLVRRAMLIVLPVGFGVALAVITLHPDLLHAVTGRDASLSGRTELWAGVVNAISRRPLLGYGYQAFWDSSDPLAMEIWRQIGWNAPNAHNGVLEVALQLGFLGVLLTAVVLGQAVVRALALLRLPASRTAGVAALILLGGITLESLTEAVFLRQGDIDWLVLNLVSFACLRLWLREAPAPVSPLRDVLSRARPIQV
jgi:exopolysaccharide production protein ExoQ